MEFKTKNLKIVSPAEKDPWSEPWEFQNKFDPEDLKGRVCFNGPLKYGEMELEYDFPKKSIESGWAKEGLLRFLNWAFKNRELYFINVTVSNKIEESFFKSLGWVDDVKMGKGHRLVKWRDLTKWRYAYALIGMGIGYAWGFMIGDKWVWPLLCIGVFLGFTAGQLMERHDVSKLQKTLDSRRRYLESIRGQEPKEEEPLPEDFPAEELPPEDIEEDVESEEPEEDADE